MEVKVDKRSGFCFGVRKAIKLAEEEIRHNKEVFCLGDIVHNEEEVQRLEKSGLKIISRGEFFQLSNCKVLLRAHGEPPETYRYARENNIILIEGTCPVVLKLQSRIKKKYAELNGKGTVVIFGKSNHPETIGLNGQINNQAVIVQEASDLESIDFARPVVLFAQTTMNKEKYWELKAELESRLVSPELLEACDTICGQVSNRAPMIAEFSKSVDAVVFVGGRKSSNSKFLFQVAKQSNPDSYFISTLADLEQVDLQDFTNIGVCGATSTPQWLMEEIATVIKEKYN